MSIYIKNEIVGDSNSGQANSDVRVVGGGVLSQPGGSVVGRHVGGHVGGQVGGRGGDFALNIGPEQLRLIQQALVRDARSRISGG